MRKNNIRKMAFVLTVALTTPTIAFANSQVSLAAPISTKATTTKEAALSITSKTIYGLKKTYTFKVNNLTEGSTLRWSSSNSRVATVNGKGKVTTVSKGTANITVTVITPDKKSKTLTCKVTVKLIPATAVTIKNAPVDNAIHVGETFDYNRTISPMNSTDKTTWIIKDTKIATVNKNGVVKGIAKGNTVLMAKTESGQVDSVPIIIEEKKAGITSVRLVNGTELQFEFSEAIDGSTVIGSENQLKNIIFDRKTDKNSMYAYDYGTLTASISTDKKVITVKSSNIFKGDYEVIISNSVKTLTNKEITYDKVLTITDTLKPTLTDYFIDETGVIATINFNEPINITNFVPSNVKRADGVAMNATSMQILTNKNNYTLSQDKKSLKIDLSNLATEDQGKSITAIFAGILDITGNPADNIPFTFQTNVTTREQAKLVSIERTGYNTMTAYYNSPIKNPGVLVIGNSTNKLVGVRDTNDYKKVTYTLTNAEASLTGKQSIYVIDFSGYNTIGTGVQTATVEFTITKEPPVVTSSKIVTTTVNGIELNTLCITYNKNITATNAAGTLNSTLRSDNDDITSPTLIYTKAEITGNQVILTLENSYIGAAGTYTITLTDGFVKDNFYTDSKKTTIVVTKGATGSSELPTPTIVQSPSNPSEVTVTFQRKIDVASAENIGNYKIPGATIISAQVTYNTTNGATVKLTIAEGTIVANTVYAVTISGVKGSNNSYGPMSPKIQNVALVENVAPYVVSAKINSDLKTITLTFSENIKGNANYLVYQNGILMPLSSTVQTTILNNKITITLDKILTSVSNVAIISGVNNALTDYNNNNASSGTISATY